MTEGTDSEWPQGVARHVVERVDSTNAEAQRLAPSLSGPTWIMTREQTAGRGRRGRGWSGGADNFAATLVLRPEGGPAQAAQLSFVAALALDQALTAVCGPYARIAIKWPNDVLLNGGKVAGILLESMGQGQGVDSLAIGIGVNLAAAPDPATLEPEATAPVSVLGETGHQVTQDEFLDLLAPAFAAWHKKLEDFGFDPIRTAWLARAAKLGETIIARTGRDSLTGRFDGIDETGALILQTSEGRRVIPAADIYFQGG
ncbi:biotin--[acetyl-CoA-carboxylase] ligase [Paracoccus tegillarcae]|uniref:biotin--[biotin carboxyl-carrier protein] ligase n=1 Tax=Paracoccus tegillarcae TaxID=1529068 RepID=A0A2K9ETC4_9RHOB|nr:biotin--[acetyl-CoA-carboxylase] ligase [Paracoccus tegillarcae]AUH35015.1 biotin--[acetyl-CoA-carboxylase] ligase [Paracoccus tegillarcae]